MWNRFLALSLALMLLGFGGPVHAFIISFSNTDFGTTIQFSNVVTFSFEIEIGEPLQSGPYTNPVITGVDYSVSGSLEPGTPSTFSGFALNRPEPSQPPIPGTKFYGQGSSLRFEIAAGADLTDGVQISDLVELADFTLPSLADPDPLLSVVTGSTNPVFVFNGREINDITGFSRFHPALLVLDSDGTGSMRNSNNIVNKNGFDQISFGSEYVTDLTFSTGTTLSNDAPAVPVPGAAWLFGPALGILGWIRRKQA